VSSTHPTKADKLALREQRAREGIIQFAEEMQAIRDERLYPRAGETDAWSTYCKEQWGMSQNTVAHTIQALPVLKRLSCDGGATVSVSAATAVATLPEAVQDAILDKTTKRDEVKARAKAVRKVEKEAKAEGREVTEEEQIRAAKARLPRERVHIRSGGRHEIDLAEIDAELARKTLPNDIALTALRLRAMLKRVPEWLEENGSLRSTEESDTLGDIMLNTLEEEQGLTEMAFALAQGSDIADEFAQLLAAEEDPHE
jgi:hypothetical protein